MIPTAVVSGGNPAKKQSGTRNHVNTDQTKKEEVREMFDNIAPDTTWLNHTLR